MLRTICILLLCLSSSVVDAQSSQNYVLSKVRTDNGTMVETYDYYDGLGRHFETVCVGVTPSHNNLVQLTEYDGLGRESKSWLSMPGTSAFMDRQSVRSTICSIHADGHPCTESLYDGSPLDRPTAVKGPGSLWYGHHTSTEYLVNTTSYPLNCPRYYVSDSGMLTEAANYDAGRLSVTKTTDEDGNVCYEFRDLHGRKVLQRRMVSSSSSADTHYVYDRRGDLRYVLQPAYQDTPDTTLFAFAYRYDRRHHIVEKRIPGADPVRYAYDRAGRLAFSQDGNQRLQSKQTFYLYDIQGRLLLKGVCSGTSLPDMSSRLATATQGTTEGIGGSGYTASITLGNPTVEEAHYYDSYDFLQIPTFSGLGFTAGTVSAKGKETGKRLKVLESSNKYLCTVTYYDIKGRVTHTEATNILDGKDSYENEYGYTQPATVTHTHTVPGKPSHGETFTYTYDHADRMSSVTHQADGYPAVVLQSSSYDSYDYLQRNQLQVLL